MYRLFHSRHATTARQKNYRTSLRVELLEARRLLATLTVVPHGFPTDGLHFRSLDAAVAAAATNDTIQVEPGADLPSFDSTTLAADANAGDTQLTTDGYIAPGQIVDFGSVAPGELIDAAAPAAGFKFVLTLHSPLPAAHPAGTTVDTTLTVGIGRQLTIVGDANAAPAQVPKLDVLASGVSLVNLKSNGVSVDADAAQVASCTLGFLTETSSQNLFAGNTLGGLALRGPVGSSGDHDQVLNNTINGNVLILGETGALLKGNTIRVQQIDNFSDAIQVGMSDNITISNNNITFSATQVSLPNCGMAVQVKDGGVPLHLLLLNNNISTEGNGIGIFTLTAGGNMLFVKIEGNDLRANRVGVFVMGMGSSNANALGIVDVGGGVYTSLGGNNFRGFTNSLSDLNAGRFAIYLSNAGTNAGSVAANLNLWSVSDPNTVVKDADSNPTTGGPPDGDGAIALGINQIDADHQYVQALYHDFLGRTGNPTELDAWVSLLASLGRQGVANDIVRSTESLTAFVDSLYLKFLNRTADPAGEANAVGFLQHGGTEEQLMAALLNAPEYYNHASAIGSSNVPDANWLAALYQQLLGRPGSATEISGWLSALPGSGRAGVARAFLTSAEYRTDQVLLDYTSLLHNASPPPASDLNAFVNSGADLLSIEVVFASSPGFYSNG
jgi:hypothetical protein